jgi:hypothetical protein
MKNQQHRSQALLHLQKLKPGDGWSLQENSRDSTVKLCRRGVPLTDNAFVDLYFDGEDVVGLLTDPSSSSKQSVQGQVLVDSKGQIVRGTKLKTVRIASSAASSKSATPPAAPSSSSTTSTTTSSTTWTPEQHLLFWKLIGCFIVGTVVLRLLMQTLFVLYICAFPLLYFYLVQNCPSDASFDAKKELKRVLRGAHLPENHPDKPTGMLSEALARIQATVATELATLPGYETTLVNVLGAAKVACVRVPSANMDFYWVGAMQNWYYVYSSQLSNDRKTD